MSRFDRHRDRKEANHYVRKIMDAEACAEMGDIRGMKASLEQAYGELEEPEKYRGTFEDIIYTGLDEAIDKSYRAVNHAGGDESFLSGVRSQAIEEALKYGKLLHSLGGMDGVPEMLQALGETAGKSGKP